ncbi:MFS transporter [Pararobbsia silviterrae]|nr:MFS transporter [Pararobbsia silviterrae]
MSPSQTIDVGRVIDSGRTNARQMTLLILCGLCLVLDGFDVQSIGYVAPALIHAWGVPKAAMGPVFGASLFGLMVGALGLSLLADRIGRRPVIIGATFAFGCLMLATAGATSIQTLLALRFVTGLALGCIMPNAMSLAGEFSAARFRVTSMMLVSCGFTFGAAAGGFVSAALIPAFGWPSVFIAGGILPLCLAIAMVFALPESIQFLVLKQRVTGRMREKVVGWLRDFDPSLPIDADTRFAVAEQAHGGVPVAALFSRGRAAFTVLLWIVNFMNLINLYFLSNWLPTLIHDAGYDTRTAVLVGTTLQVGGVIGTVLLGRMIEKLGFVRVLVCSFALACVSIALIGQTAHALWLLGAVVFVAGFCIVGGQPAINAFAGIGYPTDLRATGIGWSLGIGRIGSVVGPVVAGQLIAWNWSTPSLFFAAAVPALASAVLMVLLGRATPRAENAGSIREAMHASH